ncbi:MAG: hypothetical protein M3Z23_17825, partial [Acidobacteriota bacterium]|nr:hypothetical protein [Acidobacteriota bacterium]
MAAALAAAADWLSFRGDPERTGWQKRERVLNAGNVGDLKLLWKLPLDNQSKGLNSLSGATLLGPLITHRGIKELVIVAGASDNVYAVDADLGRLFWKTRVERAIAPARGEKFPCGAGLTATKVIAPPTAPILDEDEGSNPLRPIYVLASDGRVHALSPSDGKDMMSPVQFVAADALASSLNLVGNILYTTTADGCGGASNGVWSLELRRPGAKPAFSAPAPIGAVHTDEYSAAWQDSTGARWTYVADAHGITAFHPAGAPVWRAPDLRGSRPPLIANGILFVLLSGDQSAHATLYALDGLTGKQLYNSGAQIT